MAKKVGLVVKEDTRALKVAEAFSLWLDHQGISVFRETARAINPVPACGALPDLDLVFVLGGDGTFLSAARWVGNLGIPIFGIKFGEVGFLAEEIAERLYETAVPVLEGHYELEERMCLRIALQRGDEVLLEERVLNDVVISKGVLARLARVRTEIDGRYLTTYAGDGLIVATPTGSTAYSMAAGGPVVHPSIAAILLTPICPFTLTNRPLILKDDARITIYLDSRSSEDIRITCDGQTGYPLHHGEALVVSRAKMPVKLVKLPGKRYFDVLKEKLHWSGERI